jgi:hypothetical protein
MKPMFRLLSDNASLQRKKLQPLCQSAPPDDCFCRIVSGGFGDVSTSMKLRLLDEKALNLWSLRVGHGSEIIRHPLR